MRSAVDLPEPDGPTSTISSPSSSLRSSASTAGRSLPEKIRVASSKRTSAIAVRQSGRGRGQRSARAGLRVFVRGQVVEGEQRRAGYRRRGGDQHGGLWGHDGQAAPYPVEQMPRRRAQPGAPQHPPPPPPPPAA